MRIPVTARRLVAGILVVLMAGCESSFTYKLWHAEDFHHVRAPATNSNVAVYYEPNRKDFLVAYDSVRDGSEAPRRLNYFLGANTERIAHRKKPSFLSTNRLILQAVPVNQETNSKPAAVFQSALTIYTSDGEIGPYPLPAYEEADGTIARVALTPLAVTGDLICLGAIIAVIGAFAYAGGCINCWE